MLLNVGGTTDTLRDGLAAGMVAAVVSGAPSTLHALASGGDAMAAAHAAGAMALPHERRGALLFLAAVPVHVALSVGWAEVLATVLPPRRTAVWGALAGLGIAALDLGLIGRRFPRVRALPRLPQVADHVAYGATVGAVLARRRARR
jgi:hypothetical protein